MRARDDAGAAPTDTPRRPDLASCTSRVIDDYCRSVPPLPTMPIIDGVLECGLRLQDLTPALTNSPTKMPPAGHRTRFAAAWRPDGLYVYATIDDPDIISPSAAEDPYCGDAIEIFVDADGDFAPPAYDVVGARQFIASGPIGTGPTSRGKSYRWGDPAREWNSKTFATFLRPGGWIVEAFITAGDLGLAAWPLAGGRVIGFDLGIDFSVPVRLSDATCAARAGEYYLRATAIGCPPSGDEPFCSTTAWCRPRLLP